MIQLSEAGKRFGPKVLFQELDWLITPRDRVGLVGANGTGKTTLLKVLAGLEGLDYGSINRQKGIVCGYLPQDGLTLSGRTVFAECLSVFSHIHEMQREQEELAQRMAEVDHAGAEYQQIAERFHLIQAELHTRDGDNSEAEVGTVLAGLGFRKEDWERRTEEFSGGWQMRIALAKLLLQQPNLLLLDEPTNHLDLESRNWLEQYLSEYPYAYVLISHDRYFLDITVGKIAEIWNKHVYFYSGNYEKYLSQKTERRTQLEAAHRNQQEKIDQLQAFINRFRYQATKAKQVQSRIKELERMEKIEIPPEEKAIHFSFPQPPASGRLVAEGISLAKSYGPKQVFSGVNFVIERGDRIALDRSMLHPPSCLLVAQPTSHCYLRAKDVLPESLQKFTGTVVFVSHAGYFIDKLTTRICEACNGQVEVFPGNYEDYLWRKQNQNGVAPETAVSALAKPSVSEEDPAGEARHKRLNPIRLRRKKERCQELDEEIARLETAIADTETALQSFVSVEETKRQTDALEQYKSGLSARMKEWEKLASVLE